MKVYTILFLPIIMIICGFLMFKCPMKRNRIIGYRTLITLKNDQIWKYANQLMGKVWLIIGFIFLVISITLLLFNNIKSQTLLSLIMLSQLVMMIIPIVFIEIHLHKKFK